MGGFASRLALMNKRLVFAGDKKTIVLRLEDIVALQGDATHMQVASSRGSTPVILATQLATQARLWIGISQRTAVEARTLPPNVHI